MMAEAALALHQPDALEEVLDRLVRAACTAIPGVDFAGVSVTGPDGIATMAASDPVVEDLDRLQYSLAEGPSLDAIRDRTPVVVSDLLAERRWPRFAPQAARSGVQSQMGIALSTEEKIVGGLGLYATHRDAFDESTRLAATVFVVHAALAVQRAMRTTALVEALQSRQRIAQAVGILMHKFTIGEQAAYGHLIQMSRERDLTVQDVARGVVRGLTGSCATEVG